MKIDVLTDEEKSEIIKYGQERLRVRAVHVEQCFLHRNLS